MSQGLPVHKEAVTMSTLLPMLKGRNVYSAVQSSTVPDHHHLGLSVSAEATITGLESIKEGKEVGWLCTSEPLGRYKTLYLSTPPGS